MAADGIRGIEVQGAEPKELVLSDGSRLTLEIESVDRGCVEWRRTGDGQTGDGDAMSLGEALRLAGTEYADYVEIRTRAEAEWMRTVADWYREQAELLSGELRAAAA